MDEETKDGMTTEPGKVKTPGATSTADSSDQTEGGPRKQLPVWEERQLRLIGKSFNLLLGVNARKKQPKSKRTLALRPAERQAYKPKLPFRTVEGVGTAAWNKLDAGAVGLLMRFYEKFNGYNRFDLSVTYREVKDKMSSLIFTRWVWQLIGYGFLDIKRQGRLERNCSLYGLSDRWRSLSERPARLDEIEKMLDKIEALKRQPGDSSKRDVIRALRRRVCSTMPGG